MTSILTEGGFLLDTNVLSETRRPRPDPRVLAYLASIRGKMVCVSCLTLGELVKGAEARARTDAGHSARLMEWLSEIERSFQSRVLPVDPAAARLWGKLSASRQRPVVDTLIAATAIVHGMTLVTRNVADMKDTGVALIDPWAA